MGFSTKFNWVLQITVPETLEIGSTYEFSKPGNRIFPIDTPIDLINLEREAVAKIKIKSFLNQPSTTSGNFEVVKIYTGNEKQVLSNYWNENQ